MQNILDGLKRNLGGRFLLPALFLAIFLLPHSAAASTLYIDSNAGSSLGNQTVGDYFLFSTSTYASAPPSWNVSDIKLNLSGNNCGGFCSGGADVTLYVEAWNGSAFVNVATSSSQHLTASSTATQYDFNFSTSWDVAGTALQHFYANGSTPLGFGITDTYWFHIRMVSTSAFSTGFTVWGHDTGTTTAPYVVHMTSTGSIVPAADIEGGSAPINTNTRIIDFTPSDGATVGTPTTFTAHYYVNAADIGNTIGIRMNLHNIDQNVLLGGLLSPSDILLFSETATTSGDVYFSTTTPIGDGNYRLNAQIFSAVSNPLGGWLNVGIFGNGLINQNLSHEFIVNQETFIGHISASSYKEFNQIFASSTATSTAALAGSCNPLGSFNITNCMSFLFIPDAGAVNDSVNYFKDNTLNHAPWGYFVRIGNILSATTTTALPTFTFHPMYYQDPTFTLTVDPGDIIAGGGALLDSVHDPIGGENWRGTLETLIRLLVGLVTVVIIFFDIVHGQQHANAGKGRNNRDS